MQKYQICKRCIMDTDGDPTISFDADGYCNYCGAALKRLEMCPKVDKGEELEKTFCKIKEDCINDTYDCVIGISGGLDSSYVVYLAYQYGMRILGIHIDDGLDTERAKKNIEGLCAKAGVTLVSIRPNMDQYRDLTMSFIKASVPDLAIPQDNLIQAALIDATKKYKIKYILHGSNLAMESILQKGHAYTAADSTHIRAIHKRFSQKPIDKLRIMSTFEDSILKRLRKDVVRIKPLNLIDYNFEQAITELRTFCNYEYYGSKHHESILTRFLQCYYLPEKFNVDKRKSHLSSLIVSGQITREEALRRIACPRYQSEELKEFDCNALANFLEISRDRFDELIRLPPKSHDDYPKSFLSNRVVPFLLKNRHLLHIKVG